MTELRIAVVDVGSNTTRLYIAEVQGGRVGAELTRLGRVTRLGAGVDASGRLSSDALAREYTVLDEYQRLIQATGAQRAVAVMTSAVRDAANGGEFAADVASRFGLEVHVLSGDEEAQLTYLGTTDGLEADAEDVATLVFDIGGGSTELVIGHGAPSRLPCLHAGRRRAAGRPSHQIRSADRGGAAGAGGGRA